MTDPTTPSPQIRTAITRRHALAGAAVLGVAVPTLAACGGSDDGGEASGGESTAAAAGLETTKADIPEGGGAVFADAGVVVTQPTAGEFKGFSNICTHQGCPVADVTDTINCNCHGSKFSITDGSVTTGPATKPLESIDLTVDGDTITTA